MSELTRRFVSNVCHRTIRHTQLTFGNNTNKSEIVRLNNDIETFVELTEPRCRQTPFAVVGPFRARFE